MVDTRRRQATDAGSAMPSAVQRPSPPQVTPVVACHQEWSGKSPLSEALTEARSCPSKATRVLVQHVSVDAHVIHKLGDISALPGEDHLCGGVINAANRRARLVTGTH